MTDKQLKAWGNLLNAYDEIIAWAREHPNGDVADFLEWQKSEAQRQYAEARRESVGVRR